MREQSEHGARMGYTGKQVIHPDQIKIVHSAFLPSNQRIEWAEGLMKAYAFHQNLGKVCMMYKHIFYAFLKKNFNLLGCFYISKSND